MAFLRVRMRENGDQIKAMVRSIVLGIPSTASLLP